MTHSVDAILARCRSQVEASLVALAAADDTHSGASMATLREACKYVLANGGKRIRPALVYLGAAAVDTRGSFTAPANTLDYPACAIEMIHSYSLVHDDLPAMDDDDLRRGKPSCHVAYGEAMAVLVGDGLQARAFELLATAPALADSQRLAMVTAVARASGLAGMVGGQAIDVCAADSSLSLEQLQTMHQLKTGALIQASLALGGIAAGADGQQLAALDQFGQRLGLAFQVVDDVLDVTGDSEALGKSQGKDAAANKPTYTSLLGLDGARQTALRLLDEALAALDGFGTQADDLRALARYVVARDR